MSVTVETSGSQTATLATWHDVATVANVAGVRVFSVDLSNLTNGETVDIRIKKNTRSADAQAVIYQATYAHAQAEPVVDSVPVVVADDATFSIRQTGGTGRAFPWAVYLL
jgi:hypothetical protein